MWWCPHIFNNKLKDHNRAIEKICLHYKICLSICMETFTYLYSTDALTKNWDIRRVFILFCVIKSPFLRLFSMEFHFLIVIQNTVTLTCKIHVWMHLLIGLRNWPCLGKFQDLEICTNRVVKNQRAGHSVISTASVIVCEMPIFCISSKNRICLQKPYKIAHYKGKSFKIFAVEQGPDIRGGQACHEMRDFLLTDEHLWTLTQ